jgi:hypothetical protein
MHPVRRLIHATMLGVGIVMAATIVGTAGTIPMPSASPDPISDTLVLRGMTDTAAQDTPASNDSSPIVLRGLRPSAAQPRVNPDICPQGLAYDPGYGCVPPAYVYGPAYGDWPDLAYWPNSWFGGFDGVRKGFRRRHVHANRQGPAVRFHQRAGGAAGRSFAHIAGFGHR